MSEPESRGVRLRRLRMRSSRRGTKEMDVILSRFAEARLETLPPERLDLYESLLSENDVSLYRWVSGEEAAPERYAALVAEISRTASAG